MRVRFGRFFGILSVAMLGAVLPASADILLDTTADVLPPSGSVPVNEGQFIGLPFSTGVDTQITAITAYLFDTPQVTYHLGIMADVSGLPSNAYLFEQIVSPSANVISINPNWDVAAATIYWLVASIEPASGQSGQWLTGSGIGSYAFSNNGTWIGFNSNLPGAFIEGAVRQVQTSGIPEPATLSIFGAGLTASLVWRSRKRKRAKL